MMLYKNRWCTYISTVHAIGWRWSVYQVQGVWGNRQFNTRPKHTATKPSFCKYYSHILL